MAAVKQATKPASRQRSGATTLAAILYCWFGLAFLVSSMLVAVYTLRNGRLPVVFGIHNDGRPVLRALWRVQVDHSRASLGRCECP
jgi:hypothetical protein